MIVRYDVDHLDDPGTGMIHLNAAPTGPAGPAPVRPVPGAVCWFDPLRPDAPTDYWIDLDVVDRAELEVLVGPEGAQLREGSTRQLGLDPTELAWVAPAARLASLELVRSTPIAAGHPARWAVEAALLRFVLASLGLDHPDAIDDEVDAMLPALDRRVLPAVPDQVAVLATALAHQVADPFDRAFDHLGDELPSADPSSWAQVAAAIASLRPAGTATRPSYMSDDDGITLHDQLWVWLPKEFFPRGEFSGTATATSYRKALGRRIKVELRRPAGRCDALFVRLVASGGDGPEVVAIDSMLIDGEAYVADLDEPQAARSGPLRVEAVDDLAAPLFDDIGFARRKGRQWGQLALAVERLGERDSAGRRWRLAESYHRSAGDAATADAAAARAVAGPGDDPLDRPFWAESDGAPDLDDRSTDNGER